MNRAKEILYDIANGKLCSAMDFSCNKCYLFFFCDDRQGILGQNFLENREREAKRIIFNLMIKKIEE